MKALLKGLPLLAGLAFASPAWAEAVGVKEAVDAIRLKIPGYCNLENWQFALTLNAQNQTRVELSPTMAPEQVQCVYQSLSDASITLDRPAPVQVKQSSLRHAQASSN